MIGLLSEHIEDELNDAYTYAKLALEYKDTEPETANLFYKLSEEEMTHMEALHQKVVCCIERYRQTKGSVPEAMKTLYDYAHKREIEYAEKISVLQGMYKKQN